MSHVAKRSALLLVTLIALTLGLLAQSDNANVSGVVSDPSGSAVPKAKVTRLSLTLNHHEQEVDGTMATGDETTPVPIEKASLNANQLTFEVPDKGGPRIKFRLTATDGLSGEATSGDRVSKVTLFWIRSNGGYAAVDRVASAPLLIHKVEPEYTEEARAAKFQGTVVLKVVIEANGRVSTERINVDRSLGMGLDEKAIEAVKQWRFKPAYKLN